MSWNNKENKSPGSKKPDAKGAGKSYERPTVEKLGSVTALTTMAPATEGGTGPPPLPP